MIFSRLHLSDQKYSEILCVIFCKYIVKYDLKHLNGTCILIFVSILCRADQG